MISSKYKHYHNRWVKVLNDNQDINWMWGEHASLLNIINADVEMNQERPRSYIKIPLPLDWLKLMIF